MKLKEVSCSAADGSQQALQVLRVFDHLWPALIHVLEGLEQLKLLCLQRIRWKSARSGNGC